MATFNIGKDEKQGDAIKKYADLEKEIANKEYYLEFFHIPTGKIVQFKAMLTNFSDKYDSTWSGDTYYGRMDPLEIFRNTKRTISIGWDIVAASEEEAKSNMQKISLLVSMLYPVYEPTKEPTATSISSAPLFKLSFANFIKNANVSVQSANASTNGLVGRISGLAVTPNLDAGMFDKEAGKLYPKEYAMSFEYTVFHTHRIGWNKQTKDFFVPKFPYGEQHFGGADLKNVKNDAKDNKTTQQKQSAINKITKKGSK